MSIDDRDDFLRELERLSDDAIRTKIEGGIWSALHRKWAAEHLAERERKK